MHTKAGNSRISAAAHRLLSDELERLVAVSTQRLRESEPVYQEVGDRSLSDQMHKNITLALLRTSGDPIPEELAAAAFETGRLRAIQQVDLVAVSTSFRIDLRVLWEAFLADAERHGDAGDPAYLAEMVRVWEAVEANINEMTEGYRITSEQLRQENSELRNAAFQRLLDLGGDDSASIAKQLATLSFDPSMPLFCLVSDLREADYGALSGTQSRLAQRGANSYFGWQRQCLVGLVQAPGLTIDSLSQSLDELRAFRTGIATVRTPSGLNASIRNARMLLSAFGSPGLRTLDDNWLAAIACAEPALVDALVEQLFSPFRELSDYVREELTRVIEGFLTTNGTISAISEVTFRHRNTIRNRLLQVEELTGLKLGTPRDTALLALAFQSWRRETAPGSRLADPARKNPRSS